MKTSSGTLKDFNPALECDACGDLLSGTEHSPQLAIKSNVAQIEDNEHVFVIAPTMVALESEQFRTAFGYPMVETQFTFVPAVRCTSPIKNYASCLQFCSVWTRHLLIDVVTKKKHRKSIIIGDTVLSSILNERDAAAIEPFSFRQSDVIGRFLFLPSLPWSDEDYLMACKRIEAFTRKLTSEEE